MSDQDMNATEIAHTSIEDLERQKSERNESTLANTPPELRNDMAWLIKKRQEAVKLITQKSRWTVHLQNRISENAPPKEIAQIEQSLDIARANAEQITSEVTAFENSFIEKRDLLEAANYPEAVRPQVIVLLADCRKVTSDLMVELLGEDYASKMGAAGGKIFACVRELNNARKAGDLDQVRHLESIHRELQIDEAKLREAMTQAKNQVEIVRAQYKARLEELKFS